MKLFKKLLSYIIAFTMVLSLATLLGGNVHAAGDTTGNSLTITNTGKTAHTFALYQIFTGDLSGTTLSNIHWGNGVTDSGKNALGDDAGKYVEENLNGKTDPSVAKNFAKTLITNNYLQNATYPLNEKKEKTTVAPDASYTFSNLAAGYYLVKDEDGSQSQENGTNSAYTDYIVQVVGNVTQTTKMDIPTVDKTVEQFKDNDNGTGDPETKFQKNADHEIGKTFKFKLTATVPADVKVANYDSYELKFNDQMSKGISFDEIDSVVLSDGTLDDNKKVKEVSVPVKDTGHPNGYVSTASVKSLANGGSWSLTIENIKNYNLDFSREITATVIYDAHLNENAFVNTNTGETATKNENDVELEYSNNPNASGLGRTNKKDVYVFAYGIDSTKKADSATGDNLSGAKFTIKRNNKNGNNKNGEALKFKLVTKDNETYYLLTTDAESEENHVSTTVTSGSDGKFNIRGLDEGTYYFEETEAPAGYNTVDPFTVKITPTLGTGADISKASYKEYSNYNASDIEHSEYTNIVVDKSGSTLPSTGGMGTTLLYVAGGILVACAAAYVVLNKKRA